MNFHPTLLLKDTCQKILKDSKGIRSGKNHFPTSYSHSHHTNEWSDPSRKYHIRFYQNQNCSTENENDISNYSGRGTEAMGRASFGKTCMQSDWSLDFKTVILSFQSFIIMIYLFLGKVDKSLKLCEASMLTSNYIIFIFKSCKGNL